MRLSLRGAGARASTREPGPALSAVRSDTRRLMSPASRCRPSAVGRPRCGLMSRGGGEREAAARGADCRVANGSGRRGNRCDRRAVEAGLEPGERRGAPGAARCSLRGSQGLREVPAARDADQGRVRGRRCQRRPDVRRRGARGRTRTARDCRSSVAPGGCLTRCWKRSGSRVRTSSSPTC